ncbi:uncharacterized protein si:dkey-154b15.1 [Esox lucius]|uniref:uncharacterized protein si:dkey-154b15.1 n=1 Tax=Esox lucius TaxID=8010 RepID=UPI0009733664|nr:uncharacterized protein si:dkey-154b15.1 [Esox lucius]
MDGKAIEVLGVPGSLLAPDRMVDKLTIHFLRPRNGGGEVLTVMFPTSISGRAVVVFEKPEVADSVLWQSHDLTVEGQRFPLEVRRMNRLEFDMPVKATVDVTMFNNDEAVLRLLQSHGFQVTESRPGQLLIMGSFLKLRAVKAQLQQLLTGDPQPHSSTHTSRVHDHANQALSARRSSVNGEQRSPLLQTSQHSDLLDSGSAHNLSSPQRTSPSPGLQVAGPGANVTQRMKPCLRPDEHDSHTPSRKSLSFLTEEDVLNYALCFRKKDINGILQSHNTEIDVKSTGSSGVKCVFLDGQNPEMAVVKLQSVLSQLTATLRTQEINLSSLDHDNQVMVSKRIQKYKDIYPAVVVSQVGDTLRLVGPSCDSYEMKQMLLGKATELPPAGRTGRPTGRNSRDRRSSSMPRLTQREDAPSGHGPATTAASSHYFPSNYQDDPGRGRADQRPGEALPPAYSSRGRSGSESQSKTNNRKEELGQGRGTREQRQAAQRQDKGDLGVPAAGHKSPLAKLQSKMPSLPMSMTKTEIKKKFNITKKW